MRVRRCGGDDGEHRREHQREERAQHEPPGARTPAAEARREFDLEIDQRVRRANCMTIVNVDPMSVQSRILNM